MAGKYTIVMEPELHDWFRHAAIDAKRTVSELVVDAMEAYRENNIAQSEVVAERKTTKPNKCFVKKTKQPNPVTDLIDLKPGPYVHKIYKPGTRELNDSARAQRVDKAAKKIVRIIAKAGEEGLPAAEVRKIFENDGLDYGMWRDTLSYLNHNKVLKRSKWNWVHTKYLASPPDGSP